MRNEDLTIFIKTICGSLNLNYFLFKFKLVESEKCNSCKTKETVIHKLFYCEKHSENRKIYLNNKKVKNKKRQLNILTNKNDLSKLIKFVSKIMKENN